MEVNITLDKDFERFLDSMRAKYGEQFELINGVHPSQLDYSVFMNKFKEDGALADISADPSANARNKDLRSFISEKNKPYDKLFGMSKIFYEMKKRWGLRTAKQWYEQEFSKGFYLNDSSSSSSYFPYCYAVDLSRLAKEGLFFLKDYNPEPPKHLTTFLDDVIEFVSYLSNRQSGAVGLPNIVVWMWYFWNKDCESGYYIKDPDYYFRQSVQKLIYRLNQPFLRIDQSSFTNVSIFDHYYLEALFGGLEFPDGSFGIDHIEDIINCQKVFMEVVSDIRHSQMFTYPVLTYSLLYKDGKFKDEEFAKWCSDHNVEWQDSNFFVSDNVGVLSNCPLSPDTKILCWSDYYDKFTLSPISEVYHNKARNGGQNTIKVLANGDIVECKINKFEDKANYRITLTNGATLKTTANHLNKVYGKEYVKTRDLTTDDYLPYSRKPYNGTDNLSYEDGQFVGMFLGDGSYRNSNEVVFSLNKDTDQAEIDFLTSYCTKHFGATVSSSKCASSISQHSKCLNIVIKSKYLRGLISQFVVGDSALTKAINLSAINMSREFREGIIYGLYVSDGNKASEDTNRIYTSSPALKDTLIALLGSLGSVTKIYEDNRENRLGNNVNYVIRWFDPNGKTKRKGSYIIDDNYTWIKIKSIEVLPNVTGGSYCLEVVTEGAPEEFMLGNGIVTHNCRLLSDSSKLEGFINSIGGTALSIGSVRVNTINLVRIAYETNMDKEKYLQLLRERVILDCKTLYTIRHIIQRNIDKGLLPNYQDGALEMSKQYCTIGILGLYEVMDLFGLVDTDELGNKSYTDEAIEFATEIFNVINDVKDNFTTEFSYNVESIPGENCAGTICAADNLLFEKSKYYIYSNQWIPLKEKCTIQEKCRLSSVLDKKCSGGAIAHINVEGRFASKDMAWEMLNYIAQQGVIYFAFNTKISVCKHRHAFIGETNCPTCGEPIADTFTRVVGFYTPVSGYQEIRRKEFDERKWYTLKDGTF